MSVAARREGRLKMTSSFNLVRSHLGGPIRDAIDLIVQVVSVHAHLSDPSVFTKLTEHHDSWLSRVHTQIIVCNQQMAMDSDPISFCETMHFPPSQS